MHADGSRSRRGSTTPSTSSTSNDGSAPDRRAVRPAVGCRSMGKRLGVMGGTFDPIHYGHLVTAEEALHQFELDEVVFVPTGRPWMKEHEVVSPAEDRYLMTVIATASNPRFRVSRIEVDREGTTYAVDTLRELGEEYGAGTELFFVTGADA